MEWITRYILQQFIWRRIGGGLAAGAGVSGGIGDGCRRKYKRFLWLIENCFRLFSVILNLMKMRQNSLCYNFWHPLAKEFDRAKFGLEHSPVDDFFRSQWRRHSKSVWWLIYRWLLAACFCAGVLGSAIQHFNEGKWFIYLTDWGFFLCMYTSIFGAVLVSIHHCHRNKFDSNSYAVKLYWASHWSTLVLAILITFVYWLFIYPSDESSATALYNLWAHAFNSILMVLDHMLVAFPARILHVVYPFVLGLGYGLFSLIYYIAGGVDPLGNRYIYEILDWSKPGWAILTVFGTIFLVFIIVIGLFGLYKLRLWIHRKFCNTVGTLSV